MKVQEFAVKSLLFGVLAALLAVLMAPQVVPLALWLLWLFFIVDEYQEQNYRAEIERLNSDSKGN